MHKDYLGDAKDFAKGHIFDLLRGRGPEKEVDLVGRFFVFPMLSDDHSLTNQSFLATYLSILGGEPVLLATDRLWGGTARARQEILVSVNEEDVGKIPHSVFLDPDTGLMADDKSNAGRKRINKSDLVCLFDSDHDRVVIVFDDSYSFGSERMLGHGEEARRLNDLRNAMQKKISDVCGLVNRKPLANFGYVGMTFNLLFFAGILATHRLGGMKERLRSFLGEAAVHRIVSCSWK